MRATVRFRAGRTSGDGTGDVGRTGDRVRAALGPLRRRRPAGRGGPGRRPYRGLRPAGTGPGLHLARAALPPDGRGARPRRRADSAPGRPGRRGLAGPEPRRGRRHRPGGARRLDVGPGRGAARRGVGRRPGHPGRRLVGQAGRGQPAGCWWWPSPRWSGPRWCTRSACPRRPSGGSTSVRCRSPNCPGARGGGTCAAAGTSGRAGRRRRAGPGAAHMWALIRPPVLSTMYTPLATAPSSCWLASRVPTSSFPMPRICAR